jgi:hypothetical protein
MFFQSLANSGVQPHPPRGGHLLSQGLLDQCVAELESLGPVGRLLDQASGRRFIHGAQQLVLADVAHQAAQQPKFKLPADDRCGGQDLVALIGEPVEAPPDDLPHAFGYPDASVGSDRLTSQLSLL